MNNRGVVLIVIAACLVGIGASKIFLKPILKRIANGESTENALATSIITNTSDKQIVTDTIQLSEFKELDIDVASINVIIEQGDSYQLEYKAYEDNVPEVDQDGDYLKVNQPSNNGLVFHIDLFDSEEEYYKLTVPKDAAMIDADLHASSGRVSIEDVDLTGKIKLSSGSLKIEGISSDDLRLESSSGSISVKDIELNKFVLKLTSGSMYVDGCKTKELEAKSSSGNIDLSNMEFDKADIHVTSGNVKLEVIGDKDDYSYDLDATSGTMKLDGKKIDDDYRAGSADKMIKADLTSGGIDITFKN